MTTGTNNQAPAQTLRDGAVFVKIWSRQTAKGTFHSVELGRTYTDEQGRYHTARTFSGSELLKVNALTTKAYEQVRALDVQAKQAAAQFKNAA